MSTTPLTSMSFERGSGENKHHRSSSPTSSISASPPHFHTQAGFQHHSSAPWLAPQQWPAGRPGIPPPVPGEHEVPNGHHPAYQVDLDHSQQLYHPLLTVRHPVTQYFTQQHPQSPVSHHQSNARGSGDDEEDEDADEEGRRNRQRNGDNQQQRRPDDEENEEHRRRSLAYPAHLAPSRPFEPAAPNAPPGIVIERSSSRSPSASGQPTVILGADPSSSAMYHHTSATLLLAEAASREASITSNASANGRSGSAGSRTVTGKRKRGSANPASWPIVQMTIPGQEGLTDEASAETIAASNRSSINMVLEAAAEGEALGEDYWSDGARGGSPGSQGDGSSSGGGGSNNGMRLPPIMQVEKQHVTTSATQAASASRRRNTALFKCPVPGCGSTFTRRFNLKGHLRSHTEERPFVCEWPGCGKSFARKHDCNRHQSLHSAQAVQHTCSGCGKSFSRTDALNRHLRSEGGAACKRAAAANKNNEGTSAANIAPEANPHAHLLQTTASA